MFLRKGQAIVEAVVALAIVVMAMVGLSSLSKKTLTSSSTSQMEAKASFYLNEVANWIKLRRDTDGWDDLVTNPGVRCFNDDIGSVTTWPAIATNGDIGNCPYLGSTSFIRGATVSISNETANDGSGVTVQVANIEVEVRWRDGDRLVRRKLSTTLSTH